MSCTDHGVNKKSICNFQWMQVHDLTASSLYLKQTHTLGLHMCRVSLTQAICIYRCGQRLRNAVLVVTCSWHLHPHTNRSVVKFMVVLIWHNTMETRCSWLQFNQSSQACAWTRHSQTNKIINLAPNHTNSRKHESFHNDSTVGSHQHTSRSLHNKKAITSIWSEHSIIENLIYYLGSNTW